MTRKLFVLLFTFTAGAIVGQLVIPSFGVHITRSGVVMAQTRKPVVYHRLYTGPDKKAHLEKLEMKADPDNVFRAMPITGAELRWIEGGAPATWHNAPRRQYVIQLRGRAEIEVPGGNKIIQGPGDILLVEDTTGEGHIMRVTEDRLSLSLQLADQSAR